MTCKSYRELSPFEQREMIAQIAHLIQTDEIVHTKIVEIIKLADLKGAFDRVKFYNEAK